MTYSVIPNGLPKLPGCAFADVGRTTFPRSHVFDVRAGIPTENENQLAVQAQLRASSATPGLYPGYPNGGRGLWSLWLGC